ncbi:MAG: hypothetical protein IT458_00375 [Planctomycetes bacterium]|nr:hypothetical protein [Planctomycetota bacterium]
MPMLVGALLVVAVGALFALVLPRRMASGIAVLATAIAGACLLAASVPVALGAALPQDFSAPWSVPMGSFHLGLDPLSAWFLLALGLIAPLAAVHGFARQPVRPFPWLVLVGALLVVFTARNAVLFLVAWEVVSLASFFLVLHGRDADAEEEAGWTYLVASHLSTAFLIAALVLLGTAGVHDLGLAGGAALAPGTRDAVFLLALVGFGTKAGLMPFHVASPGLYAAAPGPVAALLAGVASKTGIYGLLRCATLLGDIPEWHGWTLLALGLLTAFFGAVLALSHADLRTSLAYSSIENVGLVFAALGLGSLGLAKGNTYVAVSGYLAALLHALHHGLFKGLLFLATGSFLASAGEGPGARAGGWWKVFPGVGAAFLAGACTCAALPPACGFVGEFLLLLGALEAASVPRAGFAVPAVLSLAVLGLTAGLAAANLARLAGGTFLGTPRAPLAAAPVPVAERAILGVLAFLCLAAGLLAPQVLQLATLPAMIPLASASAPGIALAELAASLRGVLLPAAALLALVGGLGLLRARLLDGRPVHEGPTWDCGFAAPTARMQYTPASFVAPLVALFRALHRGRETLRPPRGPFPARAEHSVAGSDPGRRFLYDPLFRLVARCAGRLGWIQHGYVQVYLLYIAATLVVLMVWKL